MPIDPSIYATIRPVAPIQTPSPLDLIGTVERVQGLREQTELRRLAGEKARQAAADEAAVRRVLTETGGDVEAALPQLTQIAPTAALNLKKQLEEARTHHATAMKTELDNQKTQLEQHLTEWNFVRDQGTLDAVRPRLVAKSPWLDQVLPREYGDGSAVQTIGDAALTRLQKIEQQHKAADLYGSGKLQEGLGTALSLVTTPEEWDKTLQGALDNYVPRAVVAQFGAWNPDGSSPARAAQLAISPKERETLAGQAATRAQTEAHQTTQEDLTRAGQAQTAAAQAANQAIARGQLDVSRGQLGVAQAREQREAATPRGVKASEGERKAAGFHGQMQQALTTINALESKLTAADLYQIQSLPQEGITGAINRGAMSDNAKRYIQAFNQFTEARLRPVSGAAIAASEYERDRATYGRQYAETPDLAQQRQAARGQALSALRTMAGSALEETPSSGNAGGAKKVDPLGDSLMADDTLAARVRAKYPGAYDDLDDATLERQVRAKFPGVYDDLPTSPAAAPVAPQGVARSTVDQAADWLPAVGGVIGGLVGKTPGLRMVTAGIGGAAGEGYRQLVQHAGEIPGALVDVAHNLLAEPEVRAATLRGAWEGTKEGAANAAIQGGIQAAGQGAGEALVGTASVASPWLMNRALNLTAKLSREFPTMSSTMLEHAITVSKGGLEQARALLTGMKATANAALAKAQAAGVTVPITAATDGLTKTLKAVLNSADIEGGLQVLADVERKSIAGRAGALTPVEADALKRSLQTQSKQLYTAAKMGQGKPNVTVRAQALADMAESLNEGIGTLTTQAGAAGYRAANAGAQELIGAVRGITNAIRPGSNLYQAMVRPGVGAVIGGLSGAETGGTKGAVAGSLVGGALTSPAGMSRLAVTLARPTVQALLRQSPKLAAALASLATESQEP